MKRFLVCLVVLLLTVVNFDLLAKDGAGELVYWVPQFSEFKEINESDLLFFKKVLKDAEKQNVKAIICELDTPGGRVDVALRYLSLFAKSNIPIIVYLNPQGISAGMIIALGADKIAINPMGVIGDAMPLEMTVDGARPIVTPKEEQKTTEKPAEVTPKQEETPTLTPEVAEKSTPTKNEEKIKEETTPPNLEKMLEELFKKKQEGQNAENKRLADQKFLTVFFKILQVLAEKNDRPVEVIRATSDPYVVLTKEKHGIDHSNNSPLTLSAKEAKELKVVDFIARNQEELLEQLNLQNATVKIIKPSPIEQVIGFLSHGAISGILIALGLLGLFIEVKTPGFGVAGTLGILFLVLFFFGHIYSGASEWGPMVIFFVGLVLLLLEVFVIPGFGLVGILGIICMVVSFVGAFGWENINSAIQTVALALLGSVVAMIVLALYVLPKTSLFKHLSLSAVSGKVYQENQKINLAEDALIQQIGIAITPLKPNGKVIINGQIYEAISVMNFIEKDAKICVVGRNSFELKVANYQEVDNA